VAKQGAEACIAATAHVAARLAEGVAPEAACLDSTSLVIVNLPWRFHAPIPMDETHVPHSFISHRSIDHASFSAPYGCQ
jgi:hypothetical protein